MRGYEFDVFISYSHIGSASKWLVNNFYPKFQDCLADQIAPAPKVFVDRTMHRGVAWPEKLATVLLRSKILIPVLTPPYFESAWCMAEWRSMCEREKVLGIADSGRPQGLIYPILYSDSDNFPEEGKMRSWWDFKDVATPEPVFQESPDWLNFHRKVTEFARDLVELLQQVPEWRSDWPVIRRPEPVLMPPPPMPRFEL
ncbi:TIR domain-containing protein [Amycolatopsis cihanbeyliensis]|uniref:TIR domain-containing protein n=1 Tax=Amycolatopsis cihanbeyliensis TaxID=1128664 RepID=UPI001151BE6C|nr:TIR domain-containing protein [Amycolatopsis cihanbeyliensis]